MFFRFKKSIALYAGGIILVLAIAIPAARLFGTDSVSVSYLKSKPLSPWSVMALVAGGESLSLESLKTVSGTKAIDLEAPMLALTSAGKDPRTFGSEDLVAKLKSFYDGIQLGEAGIINDDIFGLLAFIASGEKADDATVVGIKSFILSKQNPDGGFSFAVGGGSDTNTTAAAIMALRAAGISSSDLALAKAVEYLRTAQNNDGGFPYDPKSSWGTASDASSDAWVIMALTALGEDILGWQKEGKSPATHLAALKQEGGFYLYQEGGAEDSFTPVTTSYALLALSGKTLPVRVITRDVPYGVSFNVQVEGRSALLCDADGAGSTALDALKVAAKQCGFPYHIQSSSIGDYVDEIAGEKPSGNAGWLYSVNGILPSVGAGAYKLKDGDAVRWYFGNFDGTAASGDARIEIQLSVNVPPLPANGDGNGGGNDGAASLNENSVSLLIDVADVGEGKEGRVLGFGTLSRGAVSVKVVSLRNSGTVATTLSASVSGNALFRRYLRLDEKTWRGYRASLAPSTGTTTELSLSIPADYSGSGAKSGALIFWATSVVQ